MAKLTRETGFFVSVTGVHPGSGPRGMSLGNLLDGLGDGVAGSEGNGTLRAVSVDRG